MSCERFALFRALVVVFFMIVRVLFWVPTSSACFYAFTYSQLPTPNSQLPNHV